MVCAYESMLWSFVYRKFPKDYVPTVFETHSVQIIQNGESYTLSLFDTAGQVNRKIFTLILIQKQLLLSLIVFMEFEE